MPITSTYFGGTPYFEVGDDWPVSLENGSPYDFICQVNLSECPERPDVPFDLFTVFLSWSLSESGNVEHNCIARPYKGVSVDKAIHLPKPASRSADDYKVKPCVVRKRSFTTYESWDLQSIHEVEAAASKFRDSDSAIRNSLRRLGALSDFRSRIGGHPTWVHDNILEQGSGITFLGQIDYEPPANNCLGDSAPIYLAVCADTPFQIETDAWQSF